MNAVFSNNTVYPEQFRVTMIGAGNLATRLAVALHVAGCPILQVYSRTMKSASMLAQQVGAEPVCDISDIDNRANVLIFALTDKALPEIIPLVAKRNPKAIMAHTAGSMPLALFKGHAADFGVLYPMQTFSKSREVDFTPIPFFLEASNASTLQALTDMACMLSSKVYLASFEERRRVHLAAVFACNFANHCYALSHQLLAQYGIPFEVMLPLIDETAAKVHVMSPLDAQTGPAVRFDENVIAAQENMLNDSPLWKEVYDLMSRSIHQLAVQPRPDDGTLASASIVPSSSPADTANINPESVSDSHDKL